MSAIKPDSLYARIVETTSEGVWVIDAVNTTAYVNRAMAEMLGCPGDEIVGRSMFDFMDDEGRRIAARNVERRKEGISEAHEFVFRRRDGRALWARLTTNPLHGDDGVYQGALALVTDISDERELEFERSQLWRIIDDSANEIYLFREQDLRFEYVNRGALLNLGYTLEQMRQKTPVDIKPTHTLASYRALVAPLVAGQLENLRFEAVHARKDGTTYPVEVYVQFVARDGEGQFFAIVNDITQRREAEDALRTLGEQLAQSQRLESVGRLAGGIAHDFNNILTTILSSVTFLEGAPLDDEQRIDLREIGRAAERANQLTNQLLAFARRRLIRPRSVDLGQIVRGQEHFLRRVVGEETAIVVRIADGLWPILADPSQLEQVVLNLTVNARDAMPQGGRLVLEAENVQLDEPIAAGEGEIPPGAYVKLGVSDTGMGIAADVLPHIFEPFFTTKPVGSGTGLGLATVYGIVKQSGGHILVGGEEGVGASFWMYFPRAKDVLEDAPAAPTADLKRGHERILVVEDDDMVRRMVTRALAACGYDVRAEGTPHAGLSWALRPDSRFDLLVTDVVMPGMSGLELAKQVRAAGIQARVLFISGYTEDAIALRGPSEPGFELLAKPFTPSALTARVRELLDRR